VLLEFEHAAVIGANALKNPVTIKQTVIEDRNLRGALIVIFAINKNFHFSINAAYWKNPADANLNLNRGTGILACEIRNTGWNPVPPFKLS
jgi:putative aminopeptidase FrvX